MSILAQAGVPGAVPAGNVGAGASRRARATGEIRHTARS